MCAIDTQKKNMSVYVIARDKLKMLMIMGSVIIIMNYSVFACTKLQ